LQDPQTIPWNISARVFGNNHAFLIGMVTQWWISASPQTRSALESGPSFGHHEKGLGGGMCDALLCENDQPVGVLEVEGTRGKYTAEKFGRFFGADLEYYKQLTFGILILYPTTPFGKGEARGYRSAMDNETQEAIVRVSADHSERVIAVITMTKSYIRQRLGVRARTDYYAGDLSSVKGELYKDGRKVESLTFWEMQNA
jgi:hypothetical protein